MLEMCRIQTTILSLLETPSCVKMGYGLGTANRPLKSYVLVRIRSNGVVVSESILTNLGGL